MAEVIISDDEDYPPQLLTPPSSSNRGSVIEATRSKQNAPKSDEGVFLNQTGSQQNMKLEIFSCPMCPQNFVSYEELQSHANECIDRDPRVTGKMYENRNLDLDMSEDKKFMKLKQKNRGKGKGLDKAGEKKIMKVKICKEKSQGGKGKGKGGKPTLIPSLDDLVNFRGETIKLRLLLLQLGVETAKINVTELREGKHDIKWNRGFVTEIIKEEIAGADEWNEYTLKKRMRDAERDIDTFTMSKKEAHQTGMGDLDGDIDPTMLPIYENTKYTKPKTEIEIQMGHLKSELDKLKDDIERVHLQKYKKSQPNPKLEIKAQRLKKICNPEKSDDEVSDPEIAERETIKEVFQNQESEDNPEINGIQGTSTKTLRGTLSNKNAEKYEQSRRCRENSVRASKKEEESRRGFHGVTEINRQGEISISEPDDDDPLEVTINKFLKKQIQKSSNQTETNQMPPPPPAAPAVQAVPFYPYAMGMPYGGFGYPQPYMTAGGYPYGMTSGSGPDASNGDDPGSEPAPHLMQYNPYGGLLPSAGPGAVGGFPPGAVGGFPPGVVGGFPPGAVGGFPPGAVGGVAPGAVGGFQPGAVGGFQHGAVGGFQHGAGRGFPPGTGQGSGAGRGFPPGAGQGSGVGQIFQPGTVRGSGVGQGFPPGTGRGFQPGAVGGFRLRGYEQVLQPQPQVDDQLLQENEVQVPVDDVQDESLEENVESLVAWDEYDHCFVIIIPRHRHGEPEIQQAMREELAKFEKYGAYIWVDFPTNEPLMGTNWVVTQKLVAGEVVYKARLCMRGDVERGVELIPTDSPTIAKTNLRLSIMAAAREPSWEVLSTDVSSAFLQGTEIDRRVVVKPPAQARGQKGKVWLLRRSVYGLVDASRGWYVAYADALNDLGMETVRYDNAMFLYFRDGTNIDSDKRILDGITVTHVDDALSTGNKQFVNNVVKNILKKFTHGSTDQLPFKYVGMNIRRIEDGGLSMDQDHYMESVIMPDIKHIKKQFKVDDKLNEEGQTLFRSIAAKMNMLAVTSRPDLCFEAKLYAMDYGNATRKDLENVMKKMNHIKSDSTLVVYPNLGKVEDMVLLGFADASLKNAPDKSGSIEGQVLVLANKKTENACVLNWRSKQINRVVHSSLGAEAFAILTVFGDLKYTKIIMAQMYGKKMLSMPCIAITDSNNLATTVHSLKQAEDRILVSTIAEIKDCLCFKDCAQELRCLPKRFQLADSLTKLSGNAKPLMDLLHTGKLSLEGGWQVNHRMGLFNRTWRQLSRPNGTNCSLLSGAMRSNE